MFTRHEGLMQWVSHRVHIQGLRGMRDSCNESLIVQIYMISHNIRLANFAGNSLSPWHLRAAWSIWSRHSGETVHCMLTMPLLATSLLIRTRAHRGSSRRRGSWFTMRSNPLMAYCNKKKPRRINMCQQISLIIWGFFMSLNCEAHWFYGLNCEANELNISRGSQLFVCLICAPPLPQKSSTLLIDSEASTWTHKCGQSE